MSEIEEWRPVVGFGDYDVSSLGRVRSRKRKRGPVVLRLGTDSRGYDKIEMYTLGKRVTRKVHGLVLAAFHGPCPPGMEGSHVNGKSDDNRADNLTWEAHAENNARKITHGTEQRGERGNGARLTEVEVLRIRRECRKYGDQMRLSRELGISVKTVHSALRGGNWAHVAGARPATKNRIDDDETA